MQNLVLAHSGHGLTDAATFLHWLVEPQHLPLLVLATASVTLFYVTAQRALRAGWLENVALIPAAMGLGIGIALNNAKAALEACFGWRSEFRRTPKFGDTAGKDRIHKSGYAPPVGFVVVGEAFMAIYFAFNMYFAIINEIYVALPFLLLFLFGFSYVSALSIFQLATRFVEYGARLLLRMDTR